MVLTVDFIDSLYTYTIDIMYWLMLQYLYIDADAGQQTILIGLFGQLTAFSSL